MKCAARPWLFTVAIFLLGMIVFVLNYSTFHSWNHMSAPVLLDDNDDDDDPPLTGNTNMIPIDTRSTAIEDVTVQWKQNRTQLIEFIREFNTEDQNQILEEILTSTSGSKNSNQRISVDTLLQLILHRYTDDEQSVLADAIEITQLKNQKRNSSSTVPLPPPVPQLQPENENQETEEKRNILPKTQTFQQQTEILNEINGREFPYPLACPKRTLPQTTNYTVIAAGHIGMVRNWRHIITDQLTTIDSCGLGSILTQLFLTYSNNNSENTLFQLQDIVQRFSFASKVRYQHSPGLPWEGTAINMIRDYCFQDSRFNSSNTASTDTDTDTNTSSTPNHPEAVAFYFHTKGASHYTPDWKSPENMKTPWTYSRPLFWRKYMEYFTLERPQICIHHIVNHGAQACGVHQLEIIYAGNFWATSCSYARTLPKLDIVAPIPENEGMYWKGEGWLGSNLTSRNASLWVNLHNPTRGLYSFLIHPSEYDDFSFRWGIRDEYE